MHWVLALNAMPILGVLFFDWHAFELIFLYWLENVVIGVFTVLKFVVRHYERRIELMLPLVFAPIFAAHYGGFTAIHGMFVYAVFGEDWLAANSPGSSDLVGAVMLGQGVVFALLGLVFLHAQDWRRDVARRGLGADRLFALTTAPYRRIVVLHIAIMGCGFAMYELGEPVFGLLLLVALKTAFDVYQYNKGKDGIQVSEKRMRQIEESMNEKKFTIGGEEYRFATFTEMTRSPHFEKSMNILRVLVTKEELWMIEEHLYQKVAEERNFAKRPIADVRAVA